MSIRTTIQLFLKARLTGSLSASEARNEPSRLYWVKRRRKAIE